ncbi:MAG: hypothetical protein J4G15_03430 [Alphaproteobacteria bacterium]|nr:hypothetical protein [Alphaproteobacteria bacterium]
MTPPDQRCSAPPPAPLAWRTLFLACALALAACSPFAGPTAAVSETAAGAIGPDEALPVIEEAPAAGDLAGLQESEVVGMLGDPAFAWTEGSARMWRYDGPSCILLVFLYPDGVRHAEALGGEKETCLCEIQGGCT